MNRGNFSRRYRGNNRSYRGRLNYRGNRGKYNQNSSPRFQPPQNFNSNFSNIQTVTNYSQTQKSQNAQFENQGQQNSNSQPQASFEVVTPDPNY